MVHKKISSMFSRPLTKKKSTSSIMDLSPKLTSNDKLSKSSSAWDLTRFFRAGKVQRSDMNVAVFGLPNVGKTTLTKKLGNSMYDGCDFKPELTELYDADVCFNDADTDTLHEHRLSILDTTGLLRSRFSTMYRKTILDCHAFILVFSFDDEKSIEEIRFMYDDITAFKSQNDVPTLIVGTDKGTSTNMEYRTHVLSQLAWSCPNGLIHKCEYIDEETDSEMVSLLLQSLVKTSLS